MSNLSRRTAFTAVVALGAAATAAWASNWTDAVEVHYEVTRCVSYRAKWNGQFLAVQVTPDAGWHTFAMDNKQRAEEKLAGKKSLGIDHPTEITVSGGLEVAGPWYQTPPKDFSKPELRWFSWGFEQPALFVAKVRRSGAGPARIAIRGQACSESICKNIDVAIAVPLTGETGGVSDIDLKPLIQVH